ncbi:PilZ domain-containing protein [Sphingomonas qomolangmaensis]|uniref:PilZ domain-containing protein n=1 Tax=Sphingomonas qomolangmaensis TaxID=2918765 RepID=A0ABY5LCB3_9SPHN|nr:PilZ domain-containing protein [Sphingomonas qomolangmaensis]UUL83546.1 PilZ domain-containing protein [Sphingomonas qomolangmaensis]
MRNTADEPSEQRAHCRLSLSAQGRISEPYQGQHSVELLDISASGARIATFRQFQVGQAIYVTIDKLQAIKCDVRWVKPGEIGVSFDRPLHVSVVDHIAAANRARR